MLSLSLSPPIIVELYCQLYYVMLMLYFFIYDVALKYVRVKVCAMKLLFEMHIVFDPYVVKYM